MSTEEVITRRRLPHWYVPGAAHFLTYRLDGSLPSHVLQRLRDEYESKLRKAPFSGTLANYRLRVQKQFFARIDDWLDHHSDRDWLTHPAVGSIIRENLYHHDTKLYRLLAYCIMPNHVHVLLHPLVPMQRPESAGDDSSLLTRITHSLKSYTARKANEALGRSGVFWQAESYDHWVRDEEELERIVTYIAFNPVKAGLAALPQEWQFSSAHDRFHIDGEESGWLLLPDT